MTSAAPRRRLRSPRRLRVTREGWFYLPLTLGVGLGAINTGNNLLYLLLGLQLSTIILSGILSEAVLRGLALRTLSTRDGRAGEEAIWRLELSKAAGWFSGFSLVVTSHDGPARGASQPLLRLLAGGRAKVELRYRPHQRGHFTAREVEVSTRFPFGLFEKSRILSVEQEIFVFPRRGSATPPPSDPRRDGEAAPAALPGHGADLLHLRPYVTGEDARRIHWKKSAQAGQWVVGVREREGHRQLELELDLHAQPLPSELARLEQRIEQVAASAEVALDQGISVGLRCGAAHLFPSISAEHRLRLLQTLAAAQPILEGDA